MIPGACQVDHLFVSSGSPADGREPGDGFELGLGTTGLFLATDGFENDTDMHVRARVCVCGTALFRGFSQKQVQTVFPERFARPSAGRSLPAPSAARSHGSMSSALIAGAIMK